MSRASKLVLLSLISILAPGLSGAQSEREASPPVASAPEPSAISQVKILPAQGSLALEITSTRQIIPTITKLDSPSRLIIDLPNANLSVRRKRMEIRSDDISAVRLVQYPMTPPVVQIVVELRKPHSYTWDAAGNRLIVRLHQEGEEATAKPPSTLALTKGVESAAVPVSMVNSGRAVLADSLPSGALLPESSDPTILRLTRGGEIHVCPGTVVSVTRSELRSEMMLALSTGAVETHYALENSADSILTPDFRILLQGPGEFHYAIRADSRGNACVRALTGDTGSATVSELIGDGTHMVKPGDQLVFHSGRFDTVDIASPGSCGCPERTVPVMRASLPTAAPEASLHLERREESKPVTPPAGSPGPSPIDLSETAPLPAPRPNEVQVEIDVPLVFPDRSWPDRSRPEDKTASIAKAPPVEPAPPNAVVPLPAPAQVQAKPPRQGFFGKIKGLMSGLFR